VIAIKLSRLRLGTNCPRSILTITSPHAKALGLTIPAGMLSIADVVIE
jgi:hypothetical protein